MHHLSYSWLNLEVWYKNEDLCLPILINIGPVIFLYFCYCYHKTLPFEAVRAQRVLRLGERTANLKVLFGYVPKAPISYYSSCMNWTAVLNKNNSTIRTQKKKNIHMSLIYIATYIPIRFFLDFVYNDFTVLQSVLPAISDSTNLTLIYYFFHTIFFENVCQHFLIQYLMSCPCSRKSFWGLPNHFSIAQKRNMKLNKF